MSQSERSNGWEFPVLVNLEIMTLPGKDARPIWSGMDLLWLVGIPFSLGGFPAESRGDSVLLCYSSKYPSFRTMQIGSLAEGSIDQAG